MVGDGSSYQCRGTANSIVANRLQLDSSYHVATPARSKVKDQMSFRNTREIQGDCEGFELIEPPQSSVPHFRAPATSLLSKKQDWLVTGKHYRDSIYRLLVSSIQLFRWGVAQWLNRRIRGISFWPIVTFSFIFATIIFLLFSAAFRSTEYLPTSLKIAGILLCFLFTATWLIAWLFILRCARDEQSILDSSFEDSLSRFRESIDQFRTARSLAIETRKVYLQARANSRTQANLINGQSISSDRNFLPTLVPKIVWKNMSGETWERFLATQFKRHGYRVEMTKASGDQGVDLIVHFDNVRLAIQAKGYAGSVGNSAVQEVVSGRLFYNCSHCAVIINSRFTKSARELAGKSNCILIDENGVEHIIQNGLKTILGLPSV